MVSLILRLDWLERQHSTHRVTQFTKPKPSLSFFDSFIKFFTNIISAFRGYFKFIIFQIYHIYNPLSIRKVRILCPKCEIQFVYSRLPFNKKEVHFNRSLLLHRQIGNNYVLQSQMFKQWFIILIFNNNVKNHHLVFNASIVWFFFSCRIFYYIFNMSLGIEYKWETWTSHFEWDTRCVWDRRTLWQNHVRVTVLLWICGANIGIAKCKPLLFLARHVIEGRIKVYQRTV